MAVEQSGLELACTGDAGVTGSGFTCCVTAPALDFPNVNRNLTGWVGASSPVCYTVADAYKEVKILMLHV